MKTEINPGVIGRFAMVQADHVYSLANVIDHDAKDPNIPKRIRLQSGEHAGEVRMPGEYKVMAWMGGTE